MLKIRLQRTGRKHEPTFRIVLTDSQNGPKSGKFLEILGSYDAREKDRAVIKKDRVLYWLSEGAQPSETLHNAFVDAGVIKGKKINVLPKKTAPVVEVAEEASATVEEAPAEEVSQEAPAEETPAVDETSEVSEEAQVTEEAPAEEAPAPVVEDGQPVVEEIAEETPAEEEKEA